MIFQKKKWNFVQKFGENKEPILLHFHTKIFQLSRDQIGRNLQFIKYLFVYFYQKKFHGAHPYIFWVMIEILIKEPLINGDKMGLGESNH